MFASSSSLLVSRHRPLRLRQVERPLEVAAPRRARRLRRLRGRAEADPVLAAVVAALVPTFSGVPSQRFWYS